MLVILFVRSTNQVYLFSRLNVGNSGSKSDQFECYRVGDVRVSNVDPASPSHLPRSMKYTNEPHEPRVRCLDTPPSSKGKKASLDFHAHEKERYWV
jgi:hypothetical protein